MLTLYKDLEVLLREEGQSVGPDLLEVTGVHRTNTMVPLQALPGLRLQFEEYLKTISYPLAHREDMEYYHYEKLFGTLAHALGENYYYLKEHVATSRRVIATSSDCISVLQCKGHPDSMDLHVFMRSSHFQKLLPVDLLFLLSVVPRYIEAAKKIQKTFSIDAWGSYLDDLQFMNLYLTFGSLHAQPSLFR